SPRISGIDPLPGKANYFRGNDPSKWRQNISTYAKVRYSEVYPGIDAVYYGNNKQLEYDFIIAPRANPDRIKLTFEGTTGIGVDASGQLELKTSAGAITQPKPFAYQEIDGVRREVAANYRLTGKTVTFALGAYDKTRTLTIDPVFVYSSFYGGTLGEAGYAVAVDSQGNAYFTGETVSHNLPIVGGVQSTKGSADNFTDVFVAKVNAAGTALLYSTYLGGTLADAGRGIKVDDQGNAYVAGTTRSANFPTTPGSLQPLKSALTDGFISKLNPTGSSLVYSTYLGGDDADEIRGLAVGADGRATVAGITLSSRFSASGFPTQRGASPAYKTIDSAATWSLSGAGLGANSVNRFAIDHNNPSNIYAATSAGLYKSIDGGANWSLLSNGIATDRIQAVVIDPSNSSIVYAATETDVYKSTNAGALFAIKAQNLFPNTLAIDPATPAIIYAGSALGLFKSTNSGDTWSEVTYGPNVQPGEFVNAIAIDPVTPTIVYVGAGDGVFKTTSGNNWVSLNSGPLANFASVTALVIDPLNRSVLYAGLSDVPNLVKTTDGGANWTGINLSFVADGMTQFVNINELAIDPVTTSTVFAATTAGGIFKSVNGGLNWSQSNNGLTRLNVNTVAIHPTNPATIFAGASVGADAFVARVNASGTGLEYVRNFGGDSEDDAFGVALDSGGNAYVAGQTISSNFPTLGAFQSTPGKFGDAFVAKFDNSGNFVYSTFLGGDNFESANGIAVSGDNAYVVGQTFSSNFPIVNAIKSTTGAGDSDAFVARFNTAGSGLEFSTYLGGSAQDEALGVTVDSNGNVYVAGATDSVDFPTQNAPQPNFGPPRDGFITALNSTGSLVYSTFLGGSASDEAKAIAVDNVGNVYATGATSSNNFPTLNAFQSSRQGNDAFITTISGAGLAANVQFTQASFQSNESGPNVTVSVTRTGFSSGEATVNYATSDSATGNCNVVSGNASSKCDYEASFGTIHFAAGETVQSIHIPLVDDSYAEGNETFTISLTSPTNSNLGSPATATITILDNDSVTGPNPIDQANFFVRQHYIDFLNREPDAGGLAFWSNQITECQQPGATCNAALRRINVSAAFFLSIEFQETGYLVERTYKAAFGDATGTSNFGPTHQISVPIIRFEEFLPDSQQIGKGVVVGAPDADQVLEANKVAYFNAFVQRSRFSTSYSALLTPAQFVDRLFANAGVTPTTAERDAAINEFGGAATSADNAARARALRKVAENQTLNNNEKNRAFVLMEYFGYLRRNPNDPQDTDYSGYDFWLTKLNQFNGNFVNADMVQAFIDSGEYRARFGP
ncbi:MAG TPA: SBBP repeat-containing protein, partial [Pyrinomonadaceae bacterium]|nr:SBBP repeat-containing protein [Pyrinomonadaceae bacterium]